MDSQIMISAADAAKWGLELKEGEEIELAVTVTPTSVSPDGISATIESAQTDESEDAAEPNGEEDEGAEPPEPKLRRAPAMEAAMAE